MSDVRTMLNPTNWSIRTKLSVGILFVVLVPTLLTLILIDIGVQEHDQELVNHYLQTYGEESLADISESVDEAGVLLATFLNDVRYRGDALTVVQNPEDQVIRGRYIDALDSYLIQSGAFSDATLTDVEGNIAATTQRNLAQTVNVNLSSAIGFLAGQDAALLDEERRDAIYRDLQSNPVYEMVHVVYDDERQPVGYMIAKVNTDNVLKKHLGLTNAFIPLVSYLVTNDGLLITSQDAQNLAQTSWQRSEPISRLVKGVYFDLSGDELFSYFISPLEQTPLRLIIENYEEREIYAPVRAFVETNGPLFIILMIVLIGGLAWLLYRSTIIPLLTFRDAILALGEGNLDARVVGTERRDEIGTLARGIVSAREQVLQIIEDLEQRLADRVRDLQATQEVSRYAATQRDLQRLMSDVVNLIINSFPNIYHAQIFLIDADSRYAVLRASTGEAGEKLLRRGHRLAVGSKSVIGIVSSEGRVIVERDTATSSFHRANEFLPDTRSELAIPLRVGNTVIGALDVQSKESNTFFEDQVTLLQIMADQLAISVDNARLYQESLSQLERLNKASQSQTYQGWREHMRSQRQHGITVQAGSELVDTENLQQRALWTGETIIGEATSQNTIPVVVPIRLRGQVLGIVEWELPRIDYSYDKVLLAEELVDRLAISLDNARLFEESQRTVDRERVVNSITAKFSTQTDIDLILQTAVREVGQVLHVPEVNIRLTVDSDSLMPSDSETLSPIWEIPETPYHSNGTSQNGSANGHHEHLSRDQDTDRDHSDADGDHPSVKP
jgi:GAF domain-containing protein